MKTIFFTLQILFSSHFIFAQTFSEAWVVRHNGTANSLDWPYALQLDVSGNVYVTGYSTGTGTSKDYFTIKYNSLGQSQWSRSYNGLVNGGDYSYAMTVDANSNVYVTGRIDNGGTTQSDITTIKYDANGNQQWVVSYNGAGNGLDEAKAIVTDASGNIYIGGRTYVGANDYDIVIIKYNSSGIQQWVYTYNGTGNNYDGVISIALDQSLNIYASGESIGAGSGSDYILIKLTNSGTQSFVRRYNGTANGGDASVSVKIDNSGNPIITGSSDEGSNGLINYVTIKYNSTGVQQWFKSYNGEGGLGDFASAMSIDQSNNIYVTGGSVGTATAVDSNFATVKYSSDGTTQWVAIYRGPQQSSDIARSVTVDNSGNAYISGSSVGLMQNDYATIKYNSGGTQLWVLRYNGPGNGNDYANSVAVDIAGNVYVTGRSFGQLTDLDYATIKYSILVGIHQINSEIPDKYFLYQNYPNPFNPKTSINFDIAKAGNVKLSVFDSKGVLVKNLADNFINPGKYQVSFSAEEFSSGVYFYTFESGDYKASKKMILLK